MIKLFVQGVQLDLFKSEVFAVSKAVSKLGEFDLRHGDVSINFNVPSTAKNVATFGNISDLNNFNKNAFKRFEGELIEDESIISSGYFQVLKINPAEAKIEVRFYGGNSDWFDLIKKRDINGTYRNEDTGANKQSYNLQYLNHTFDKIRIVDSWDNDDGYFYFPVDNGKNSTKINNVFTNDDFQVGVFQHTIVKHIFDSIGIKLNGTLFNDPLYYNTLINKPTDLNQFKEQNNSKSFNQTSRSIILKDVYKDFSFPFNDQDNQWNGNTFTASTNITTFDIQYLNIASHFRTYPNVDYGDLQVKCEYTINGIAQTDIIRTLVIVGDSGGNDLVYRNIRFQQENYQFLNVIAGDTFKFTIRNINSVTPPSVNGGDWFTENVYTLFPEVKALFNYQLTGANTPYEITNTLPEINQGDFIKDVMFRHGAVSQFNSKTRTLTINKFQNLEENKPNAVDLSSKIDLSKAPVFDFTKVLNKFKKTSRIVYSQDDSDLLMSLFRAVFKRNLGDAVIPIDNDNLTGEANIYESEFSGTLQSWTFPYPVDGDDSNSNFYLPTLPIFKPTDNGEFEVQDLNARIFVKAGKIPVTSFNSDSKIDIVYQGEDIEDIGYAFFAKQLLNKEGLIDLSLNDNSETLAFENVNQSTTNYIGRTLIEKNYGLYFNILDNPIHLTINLNLDALDIQNLDFFTPVWLNFSLDSGYYYLDNVSQYKGDGTTTSIELIKI